jgi:hypothetical protein
MEAYKALAVCAMNGGQEQLWVDWPELAHGHDVEVTEPRAPAIAFRCTHGAIYDSAQQARELTGWKGRRGGMWHYGLANNNSGQVKTYRLSGL